MKLITKAIEKKLLKQQEDAKPALKLFCPWGAATWLISEMDPEEPDQLFGLCDLGIGYPELGYVSLKEITDLRGPFNLMVERDLHFIPTMTISQYAEEAQEHGRIAA